MFPASTDGFVCRFNGRTACLFHSLDNILEIVLAIVLNLEIFLKFVETELISSFELTRGLRMLLDRIVCQMDVRVVTVQLELVGACAYITILVPIALNRVVLTLPTAVPKD
jgi:hypothetical protein